MAYLTPASLVSNNVLQYTYMNQIADNLRLLSLHDHSGSLGEGSSTIYAASSASSLSASLVYRDEVSPGGIDTGAGLLTHKMPITETCFLGTNYGNGWAFSSCFFPRGGEWGWQGASPNAGWKTQHYLYPGTYKIEFYYAKSACHGVLTLTVNGSLGVGTHAGEVDFYGTGCTLALFSGSFSTSTVPTTIFWMTSTSKNGSATACVLKIGGWNIRMTGS